MSFQLEQVFDVEKIEVFSKDTIAVTLRARDRGYATFYLKRDNADSFKIGDSFLLTIGGPLPKEEESHVQDR